MRRQEESTRTYWEWEAVEPIYLQSNLSQSNMYLIYPFRFELLKFDLSVFELIFSKLWRSEQRQERILWRCFFVRSCHVKNHHKFCKTIKLVHDLNIIRFKQVSRFVLKEYSDVTKICHPVEHKTYYDEDEFRTHAGRTQWISSPSL